LKYSTSEYYGARCRSLDFTWLGVHLDVSDKRRRCPGFGFDWSAGRKRVVKDEHVAEGSCTRRDGPGGYLDLNAPMGDPNRAGVHGGGWQVTLGLPSFRGCVPAGTGPSGRPRIRGVTRLRSFHLDGLGRYKYHKDPAAPRGWARNARPEPLHWGWLTIERRA
jgi:hypothetical protein